jgi:hypothetical protein
MMIKFYVLLAAGFTLLPFTSYAQVNGTASNEAVRSQGPCFSIDVVPPSNPVRLNEAANIQITVKNISGKDIYWSYPKTNTLYKTFHVLLEKDGRKVDTTVFHRKMMGEQRPDDPQEVEGGSSIALPLAAGASFTWTMDIKKLYDIKQPGNYILSISRFDDCNKASVQSKPVILNFTSE